MFDDAMGSTARGGGRPGERVTWFAAGYAACFGGALDFVGKQHKQDAANAKKGMWLAMSPSAPWLISKPKSC
jgi:organic hydroperoxide reductase OsmC/OhrA